MEQQGLDSQGQTDNGVPPPDWGHRQVRAAEESKKAAVEAGRPGGLGGKDRIKEWKVMSQGNTGKLWNAWRTGGRVPLMG